MSFVTDNCRMKYRKSVFVEISVRKIIFSTDISLLMNFLLGLNKQKSGLLG